MANGLAASIEPFFEKVEKLSRIQRIAISVALFGIVAGGFIYFLFFPKYEQIKRLDTQLEQLEKKLDTAKRNAKDLKKFQTKLCLGLFHFGLEFL